MSEVRAATDAHAADWVVQGVRDFGHTVGSLAPAAFEHYARVFHPAMLGEDEVRWTEVAGANGRVMHPAAEWGSLTGSWRLQDQPDLWDQEPQTGQLPERLARCLVEVLAGDAQAAHPGWFGVWGGWGDPMPMLLVRHGTPPEVGQRALEVAEAEIAAWRALLDCAPTFDMPDRPMHLFEGPLRAVSEFYEDHRNPPSIWWPDDRSWCVATDIDLMTTYVGGSRDAIQALLNDSEQIEALAVPVDQSVTWEADTINPLPLTPY